MAGESASGWRWRIAQAAEIRWWRSYLKKKAPGEYLDGKTRYWEAFLERVGVAVPEGACVLDAGCGPAGIFLAMGHARVDAVDPLLDRYRADLLHFEPEDYPWVTFHTMPLEDLDRVNHYDMVFCLNVINHVADLGRCLQRLLAAGRPGSTFVMSIDCHNHGLMRRLFGLIPGDILHPHQYTLEEYVSLARRTGWEVEGTHLITPRRLFDYHALVCRVPGTTLS